MQTVPRLIEQFTPEHYELSLNLDRIDRKFSGIVTINGSLEPTAEHIILHAKDLVIESVTLDGKEATFATSDNDELHLTRPDLTRGKHIIVISFDGRITDAMNGLYPCYFEHKGVKKELLATQFESHYARQVFPCIDEPEAKATFDVTLTTENNITVLGNMPIKSQKTENNNLVTSFKTTPRMSSYLLGWVVGELHKKTAMTKGGVEVNVWATPAQSSSSLDFALSIATRTIDFFNEYFGVAYPLPKSDHIALPDFSNGAMENWGLITYRETTLLADPKTASITNKHYLATVIAHELAHQWFGNLVTMKWWNDLWLNESFATMMEYVAIDSLEPDWNVWLDFSSYESIASLRRDSLQGVQAVQTDVNHPDEINTIFDGAIVYAKGARLLRMLQTYIGHEAFRAGLKTYFNSYAYTNTTANDLWDALSKASGKDIASFMNTWIAQSGFPVLHVSQSGDQISLAQEQFIVGPHKPSDKLWPIPLNSPTAEMPELMAARESTITYQVTTPLRLNVGDTAHFITHYSNELLDRLVAELKAGNLSPLDRLQLLHEQTLMARASIIASAEIIPLLDTYANETTEAVWDIIAVAIVELKKFVEDDKVTELKLRALVGKLASSQYNRLGWDQLPDETETDTKLRATIIGLMLYSENTEVVNTAIQLYRSTPLDQLNPELRSLIISAAVRFGNDSSFIKALLETHRTSSSAELKQDICIGITSTKDVTQISQLLITVKDTDVIRPQDTARWVIGFIRGREGRVVTWQWIRDNWQWLQQTFADDKSYDDYPRYAAGVLSTQQQLSEYKDFFIPLQSDIVLKRVVEIGIGEIEGRVELIEHDGPAVRAALLGL